MESSKIIVTGTNELSGWEIHNYLGIVSSHVVAGTGLFSDITAGLTDLFGGRSGTYQNQIQSIENEAFSIVIEKAKKLGATAILGVKIDHDEISGKSMQMFMVTVYGTAVVAVKDRDDINIDIKKIIDKESVDKEILKLEIIEKTKKIPFSLSSEEWGFVYNNEVVEVNNNIIANINYYQNEKMYIDYKDNITKYYALVRNHEITNSLYKCMLNNASFFDIFNDIIKNCKLSEYNRILEFLENDNVLINKYGLLLLNAEPLDYSYEDYSLLNTIEELIRNKYKQKVEYIEEKTVMSSKLKKKWVCKCGQKNDESNDRCSSCSCDKYGFTLNEPNIKEVQILLRKKIEALKNIFKI